MSERATLTTKVPPVGGKSGDGDGSRNPSADTAAASAAETGAGAEGVEMMADDSGAAPASITIFQGAVYGSMLLTVCLAGFAAVALFQRAGRMVERRFSATARSLGVVFSLAALHGLYISYLYTNHLWGEIDGAPVAISFALWILAGPAIGVALHHLLTIGDKPARKEMVIDATAYTLIFACATVGASPGVRVNAAVIAALLALFLFIVPVARYMAAFRTARARHPELGETGGRILVLALLLGPGLIPVMSFARVCGLGDDITQFLLCFILFDFVFATALALLATARTLEPEPAQATEEAAAPEASVSPAAGPGESAKPAGPKKSDPEPAVGSNGSAKPGDGGGRPARRPAPPPKPRTSSAPGNTPSRVKAPAKPKRRF